MTVNWDIIGDILMAAGVLGLVLSIWMMNQARRRATTDPRVHAGSAAVDATVLT